jgi:CspA family cold shock protein
MNGVFEGKVKWYSEAKGYGWIATEEHGDFYFHGSNVLIDGAPTLKASEVVSFTVVAAPRGPRAINVQRKPIFANERKTNHGNTEGV